MIWLSEKIEFPPYESATKDGVIAIGGDLSPERLIYAYQHGIFPWYCNDDPIVWHSPPQRMVLYPDELIISKSMRKILKNGNFLITENKAFEDVIYYCKHIKRKNDVGTWITNKMEKAYINLHQLGYAKSIEVWQLGTQVGNSDMKLVGGLYGVEVGKVFCGESMFSLVSNSSKVAFIHLVQSNRYKLIDCQVYNDHLSSLGAKEISRNEFLSQLVAYI
ncbi:MAG: Leucyl/phenylalanyl-tRNA--protein transferase [Flavobacterium sp. SCGC AAA160-P02]|nr:MAG: Leucyl/phenylalanyl-tRNA--protein transferase [Flavobacterium sp. SCGC AAA160-P02]